jgi:hypothetical protein
MLESPAAVAACLHQRAGYCVQGVTFTPELADRILDGLAAGRTLFEIYEDEGMPATRTVHRWAGMAAAAIMHFAKPDHDGRPKRQS